MKIQNLIALVSTIIGLILIITFTIIKYEPISSSKSFIIKNKDKIKYVKDGDYSHYSIDSLKGYYTDVSINLKSDKLFIFSFIKAFLPACAFIISLSINLLNRLRV